MSRRSLVTGAEGVTTLQIEAVYKNGSTIEQRGDWERCAITLLILVVLNCEQPRCIDWLWGCSSS